MMVNKDAVKLCDAFVKLGFDAIVLEVDQTYKIKVKTSNREILVDLEELVSPDNPLVSITNTKGILLRSLRYKDFLEKGKERESLKKYLF